MELNTKFMKETFFIVMKAIPVTLEITLFTMIISLVFGFALSLKKIGHKKNLFINFYVSFVRGTPIVLQILFFYSLLPTLLNYILNIVLKLNIKIFDINPIFYALAVFVMNTTAVLCEVFRASLLSIGHGQMEAALAVGLTPWQAMRRIIIPQSLTSALPNICNTTVNVLKSTSLAYMMTVQDIMAVAKKQAAFGYNYIEAYLVVLVWYIILCTVIQLAFRVTEIKVAQYKQGKRVKVLKIQGLRRFSYAGIKERAQVVWR
ncbi:amino acid ABC transporter permease [Oribacterium sp. C9]|uniref:amino acid ABC transporter permease n=1 Tax=Oribacterium sp. C9 TaxID=1943579 RepID=UPI00098F7AF4|nr:amino acid ABC transporter permease [Oribacterium sp. C9]